VWKIQLATVVSSVPMHTPPKHSSETMLRKLLFL
jgi:hypothetical protein